MYKGIKWLLSSIETPTSVIFSKRITEELTNILENTGATISLKRAYIKELRMARLNARRKRYFNKWLRRKKWKKTKKWKKRKNKYGIQIRYRGLAYPVRKNSRRRKNKYLRLTKAKILIRKNLFAHLKKKKLTTPKALRLSGIAFLQALKNKKKT